MRKLSNGKKDIKEYLEVFLDRAIKRETNILAKSKLINIKNDLINKNSLKTPKDKIGLFNQLTEISIIEEENCNACSVIPYVQDDLIKEKRFYKDLNGFRDLIF